MKFLIFSLLPIFTFAQVEFLKSWEEARKASRMEGKMLFVFGYTEWSEESETVIAYSFSDLEVSNYFNSNFINLSLDLEEFPGLNIVDEYQIKDVPSFIFLDVNARLIHRACGPLDANGLLQLGKDALDETNNLKAYISRFKSGERSESFLLEYLMLQEEVCLDVEKFAENYLLDEGFEKLSSITNWKIFNDYHWDIFSPSFDYLINNKSKFYEEIGQVKVDAKLHDTFLAQYQEIYVSEELHEFALKSLLSKINGVSFSGSDTLLAMVQLHLSFITNNWSAYAENAIAWVAMTKLNDPDELSEIAWNFYKNVDDKTALGIAQSWMNDVIMNSPTPSRIDTYASLLFKIGNKKKAIEFEEQAIKMADELGDNLTYYKYQLQKFKEG